MQRKFNIEYTSCFEKNLKKLDSSQCTMIKVWLQRNYAQMEQDPFKMNGIKKLKGKYKDLYRYRIGKYRIVFVVEEQKLVVLFLSVSHRKETYK